MYILITVIHVVMCIVLILVVLLQAGKGASMGAAFGGSSQTIFGSTGPGTFLSKMTTGVAIVFMITSLALSHSAFNSGGGLMKGAKAGTEKRLPAPPAQPPVGGPATAVPQAPPAAPAPAK